MTHYPTAGATPPSSGQSSGQSTSQSGGQPPGPGDLLADRYRLSDLLQETSGGRLWRAHDLVLSRDVAVHLIAAGDPRADDLLGAARRSAVLVDRRILRVLDAESRDDTCYVVSEWADGTSLDILLEDGPLDAQRAAWITSEAASALATAHAVGYAHGRVTPESVLIDASGTVRIIGFAVDAALAGLPQGKIAGDVTDLGALLYAGLTGRWPGRTPSERVPTALYESGRVLRARQVRAGVPTPLDALCDQVLTPDSRGSHTRTAYDLTTALGISEAVTGFVGDPTVLAEAEAAAARMRARLQPMISLPPEIPRTRPTPQVLGTPDPGDTAERTAVADVEPTPGRGRRIREPETSTSPPVEPAVQVDPDVTQAGVPIFHDDPDGGTDVSWFAARPETPPPPPPFEPAEVKPLFAPAPPEGEPLRRPRPHLEAGNAGTETGAEAVPEGSGFWPWSSSTGTQQAVLVDEDGVETPRPPGIGWLRIAGIIAVTSLLLLAIVAAFNLGQGQSPFGGTPTGPSESATEEVAPASVGEQLPIAAISDFDPQAEPPEERPDLVPLVFDEDPATVWHTETYLQNFGPEGLKDGLGLIVDLGDVRRVTSVELTLEGTPTNVSIAVTPEAPTTPEAVTPVEDFEATESLDAVLQTPVEGRYVTLWLTSLPKVDGGFQARIGEVVVRGE